MTPLFHNLEVIVKRKVNPQSVVVVIMLSGEPEETPTKVVKVMLHGCTYEQQSPWAKHALNFQKGCVEVRDMLKDIRGEYGIEGIRPKG